MKACWVFSDAAAGNQRQARALARALLPQATMREVEVALRLPWRWLAPSGPADFRRALTGTSAVDLGPPWPALAVGCGRAAALATAGLRQVSGGATRVVQVLDPRRGRHRYDALVLPAHDRVRGDNVVTTLGALNEIDDGWLAAGRQAFADLGRLPGPRIAVLVGGPTRALRLDRAYLDGMLDLLERWLQRQGGSLLVTCSRRTPAGPAAHLRRRLAGLPGRFWAGPADGDNPYAGLLGWAEHVVCTADSANLLSEASATRVPVHVHLPRAPTGRVGRLIGELVALDRIRPLREEPAAWHVLPVRELARITPVLRERLDLPTTPP
ncbi:MAG: mitochondrial fission ELM1 family protein [Xanthomonadales bacterium]|nr:mitochondrial fission ELM1 family protein [Xanthomonadales bacterium]